MLKDFIDKAIVPILLEKYAELIRGGRLVASDADRATQQAKSKTSHRGSVQGRILRAPEPLLTGQEVAARRPGPSGR